MGHDGTHVFVDDYERKVERSISNEVFQRAPMAVKVRTEAQSSSNANQQAHWVMRPSYKKRTNPNGVA